MIATIPPAHHSSGRLNKMIIRCNFKGISSGSFSGHGGCIISFKLECNRANGGSCNARSAQRLGIMDHIGYSALTFIFLNDGIQDET